MTTKARLERLEKAIERLANPSRGLVMVDKVEGSYFFEDHRYASLEELVAAHGLRNTIVLIGDDLGPDPPRPEDMTPCP